MKLRQLVPYIIILILLPTLSIYAQDGKPPTDLTTDIRDSNAPIIGAYLPTAMKDRYIVVFKKTAKQEAIDDTKKKDVEEKGGKIQHHYDTVFKGFAGTFPRAALNGLRRNPHVAYIAMDQTVTGDLTQTNPPGGLDRIDQKDLPLNKAYNYTNTGAGVNVYVFDSGVRKTNTDFENRVTTGYNTVADGNAATTDCNGHGTHVAGIIAGKTYGVAKGATIHPIRVLGCDGKGSFSGIIAGVDWVTKNRVKPAVANFSLGGPAYAPMDDAVRALINSGVIVVVAAGNENADACTKSPARVSEALTIGASNVADQRWTSSNYGKCLDLFAPGVQILSTYNTNDTATIYMSGTSMAAPHVAGVVALILQSNASTTQTAAATSILGSAVSNKLTGLDTTSPNILLNIVQTTTTTTTTPTPAPAPTAPCTSCTKYTGTLAEGQYAYQPNGNYYYSAAGTHKGWLVGPTSADFDLHLYKYDASTATWWEVSFASTDYSQESIAYSGTAGYYTWIVDSYTGSGSYSLWIQKP